MGPGRPRPSASIEALRRRAEILADLRRFFAERDVLEVETPVLGAATVTDLHLESVPCRLGLPSGETTWYLQTSPELGMKRLLAAGSGAIFQISRAFRDGEAGRLHNPEFTILEWYRPGWDHLRLADEVVELLGAILERPGGRRRTYREVFESALGLDPHRARTGELAAAARKAGIRAELAADDAIGWLDLLWSHAVEPDLGTDAVEVVVDFPASQASLARIRPGDPPVAERFEVYVDGLELANGYHELTDPDEQARRFAADLAERGRRDRRLPRADDGLVEALRLGLPDCSGVALGVDRLVMVSLGSRDIRDVLAFPVDES